MMSGAIRKEGGDDAPMPMDGPEASAAGPVPYVPPARAETHNPASFDPRRVVRPHSFSAHQLSRTDAPAPYTSHPGWAAETNQPRQAQSFLSRLTPVRTAPAKPSSGPIKPFIAGFLFGVSLVLIVGRGWNTPEPQGPSWTLPSQTPPPPPIVVED